ncbi:unnamed protein product [Ambrosiozyma monospora]|uniref:Unnamed protein product n=1 Tax=Ambrosiozyma monospora TaxID=43982 RepID=A0A9W7DJM4_AMBMO|nr:unnamed protein product [Ambrosiozyma monospora]
MEQLDPSTSLDPLIKAVYIMIRSEPMYMPKPIGEIVGSMPDLTRTYSNDSIQSSSHRRFGRTASIASHTPRPENTFTELATKLDQFSRGYYDDLKHLNLDHDTLQIFKAMIVTFNSRWRDLPEKDMKKTLNIFHQSAAVTIRNTDKTNPTIFLVYYVYFIDLLLSLRTTTMEHKAILTQERYNICQKKVTPTIQVQNFKQFRFIGQVYGVTMQHITNRVLALQGQCKDANILNELSANEGHFAFKQQDFSETMHFLDWKKGRDKFRAKALDRFQQQNDRFTQVNSRAPGVSPVDPYHTLDLIVHQMLNGFGVDNVGLGILKDCAFVWQIDGYKGFMTIYKAFLRVSEIKHDIAIAINGRDAAKKILQFCFLPYEPEVWPFQLKQQGDLFERINSQLMETAAANVSNIFDIESLGTVLVYLTRIKQNSPFGITDGMNASFNEKMGQVAKKRVEHRVKPVPQVNVTLAHLYAFLETIVDDLLYLNSDLISEFEAKGDWSFAPMREMIAKLSIVTARKIVRHLTKTVIFDKESQKFVRTFKVPPEQDDEMLLVLKDINTIRELCQYSSNVLTTKLIDFFFPDIYTMHVEMCEKMAEYVQNAIESDKFEPLEGASYSASVRDMFELFERTLNEAEEMNWPTDIHNAK